MAPDGTDGSKRCALPDDPVVEILSRVPAKSVCRFKCVSKAWRNLIDDPHNRKKLPQAMQGFLYCHPRSKISEKLPQAMQGLSHNRKKPKMDYFCFADLTARSVPPFIDPFFSFLTELPGIQFLDLLDSCNGLVLFEHRQHRWSETLGYVVCNPTTKQWQDVPISGNPLPQLADRRCQLAFDPLVSSHFQLVHFEADYGEEEVFVLVRAYSSEMGTWSHNLIDEYGDQGHLEEWHHRVRPSSHYLPRWAFVNGNLHLIAWDLDQCQEFILALDVQRKTRRMIALPGADWICRCVCYVGQSQGRLHCITKKLMIDLHDKSEKLYIWVLQDYDTQEWVLKDTLNPLELFVDKSCGYNLAKFKVVDIHQDCDVVFFSLSLNNKLIAYDMGRKEVSVVATFEPKFIRGFARYVPYFSESPALTNNQ